MTLRSLLPTLSLLSTLLLKAHQEEPSPDLMPDSVVTGKATNTVGEAVSASTSQADNEELSQRPVLRRGELLEVIPGFIATQHSGGGKANQYFVRGFNLDHGTDFHVGLDGMPANYRTHSHGQGYADINFIVPEFVERLDYFKGPINTACGDLANAGGAEYRLFDVLASGFFSVTYGSYDFARFLLADSWGIGKGHLSFGLEFTHEDGPWNRGNDYHRYNLFARYHEGDDENFWNITALAHRGDWNSSDQKPARAIADGTIGSFGTLDPTTGGDTTRHSLSTQFQRKNGNATTRLNAWGGYYDLELFSNFTYFLENEDRGDQFEQSESRVFAGFDLTHRLDHNLSGFHGQTTFGFQTRNDWINDIGLYLTEERNRYETVRQDDVFVGSYSLFVDHETRFNSWFRAGLGLRGDLFHFDVQSDLDANSGNETDAIFSPKLNLAFGPWNKTEVYLNAGYGFHSNDARGTTISVDPTDGVTPLDPVDPLVRTKGSEIGVRTAALSGVIATLNLWYLESDSELVYVGDAGTSEAGPASERWGVEATLYWRPSDWFTFDAEYAWTDARFVGVLSNEDQIPNAIEHTLSAGFTIGCEHGWFGAMRARYFSARPLEETGTFNSLNSFIVNARIGYRKEDWEISIDVLNLFDQYDRDIEYFYESRLNSEPSGARVSDIHFQPMEPRQARLNITYRF
ncbi:MAG: TonB-dependent receptor [Akkermansiaceae bacterium]